MIKHYTKGDVTVVWQPQYMPALLYLLEGVDRSI